MSTQRGKHTRRDALNVRSDEDRGYLPTPSSGYRTQDEQQMFEDYWHTATRDHPPGFFRPSDTPTLKNYVRCLIAADLALSKISGAEMTCQNKSGETVSPQVRIYKDMAGLAATLAAKLRLTPSSRMQHTQVPKPRGPAITAPTGANSGDKVVSLPSGGKASVPLS